MTPFLEQVAKHYADAGNLADTLFIFPNRRSLVFFRKYLCDLAKASSRVMLLPRMMTVSDFYHTAASVQTTDRITLLLRLYDCYRALNPKAEPLDDFIYWGDVILADFDDVDKYRIDARNLFANVRDLKSLRDDFSYADEGQRAAIEKLAGHFAPEVWQKRGEMDVKESFLLLWEILHPLYDKFRATLRSEGLAYDGMVYRDLSDSFAAGSAADVLSSAFTDVSRFVFVGLNVISDSERFCMSRMRDAGLAEFCWDNASPIVSDRSNIASRFMADNVERFPQSFELEPVSGNVPAVHVCSVPSSVGQARLLPGIVSKVPENARGLDFAVVLADETLLPEVLFSIPESVESVNVTMGYPMSSSEFVALLRDIMAAQGHLRCKEGVWYFYHKSAYDVLSSGLFKSLLTPAEAEMVHKITADARYYIPASDFASDGILGKVFRPVLAPDGTASEQVSRTAPLADYMLEVISGIASVLGDENAMQKEFALQCYKCVSTLRDLALPVLPRTWNHLLQQLIGSVSIPFEGEPLGGLQVMGPLETRALDFRNIVIMNANEGVFPRKSISASFVPPELRRAFGLPTYENQDAVWAYYFYRLIARAENVWMMYDSRTDGLVSGEESRYIKQLRYVYPDRCTLDESVAQGGIGSAPEPEPDCKSPEALAAIAATVFSASSIEKYIACPMQFYYSSVLHLSAEDQVKESLDAGLLGTVCHDTLEALYSGGSAMYEDKDFDKRGNKGKNPNLPFTVTRDYLQGWLDNEEQIKWKINSLICRKLRCLEVQGRDLVAAEIAVRYVKEVLSSDLSTLCKMGKQSFRVLGLEEKLSADIAGHKFSGYVDRIDSFEPGKVRVVDYKTGGDDPSVLSPAINPCSIFSGTNTHKFKPALQFFIYDRFLQQSREYSSFEISNSMYALCHIFEAPAEIYPFDAEFAGQVEQELQNLFNSLENPDVGFKRVDANSMACKFCDFKTLCGRCSKND